jgi:hypothetical protein
MRKIITIILFLAPLFYSFALDVEASPKQTAIPKQTNATGPATQLVGNIKNYSVVDGCGCYFQFPAEEKKQQSNRYILMADIDEDDAWMNIDGRDVKLRLIKRTNPAGKERKGSRSSRKYTAKGITVQVDRIATSVCAPSDESCEFTGYSATITVTKGNRKQVVKTSGGCGC